MLIFGGADVKAFFVRYSYSMMKLFLNQIAIALFGLGLAMACGMAGNHTMQVVTGVGSVLFYLFLQYANMWELGAKDGLSVQYGHKEYRPLTGLWIGLLANALNFLLAIGILLGTALPSIEFFGNIGGGSKFLSLILQGMYSGLLALKVGSTALNAYVFSYFLIPLPAIAATAAAYYFGLKNKRFTRLFDLKNDTKRKS